jgi:hypothetical protein
MTQAVVLRQELLLHLCGSMNRVHAFVSAENRRSGDAGQKKHLEFSGRGDQRVKAARRAAIKGRKGPTT